VPAVVRPVTPEDYFPVTAEAEDWNLRWKLAADPSAQPAAGDTTARVVVSPASPLPVSDGWKLLVKAGLPSMDGGPKLAGNIEIAVGQVSPLKIQKVECGNYINSGPTATIVFDRSLAPDITAETAAKFFRIEPEVPSLAWEVSYDMATVRGRFEVGKEYTLRIGDAVVSGSGEPFAGEREFALVFNPVPPRLYLPELTMSQILGGRGVLPVKSVNLLSLKVRAVLLEPDQALRGLSAFKEHEWKYSNETPIPTTGFTGKTIADKTIAVAAPQIDKASVTELDWTRILGGKKAGIIYLEITGTPLAEVGGKKCAAQALGRSLDQVRQQYTNPCVLLRHRKAARWRSTRASRRAIRKNHWGKDRSRRLGFPLLPTRSALARGEVGRGQLSPAHGAGRTDPAHRRVVLRLENRRFGRVRPARHDLHRPPALPAG
jgi:hypothetical protein